MKCDCIRKIEEELGKEYPEARINAGLSFPEMKKEIIIEFSYQPTSTYQNKKRKRKTGNLVASYCPFCGTKSKIEEKETKHD